MPLKELRQEEEFPKDFWNYNINPILGYKYEVIKKNTKKDKYKYGLIPIPNKQ